MARRARWVLTLAALVVLVAMLWGTGVFGSLTPGGFEDPNSGSAQARELVDQRFGGSKPDLVLLYSSSTWKADDQRFRSPVETQLNQLPTGLAQSTVTYWSTGSTAMVSGDGHTMFALVTLRGDSDDAKSAAYAQLRESLGPPADGIRLQVGGDAAVSSDVTRRAEQDIQRAEMIALPLTAVLLVCVFGGLVAAGLPLLIGALSVLGALIILRLLTVLTDVSVFAVNIIVMLGLGLSIDYALLIVTRFREETAAGHDVHAAVVRTLSTAGRTVTFSGVTVAVSLASLLLFPQPFLRSMGLGGIAAVLVAVLAAVTVLPALLTVLGHRVSASRPPRTRPAGRHRRPRAGAWHRFALRVMRRPLAVGLLVATVLLALGSPFLRVTFGSADYRALPKSAESRVVAERMAAEFPAQGGQPLEVLVRAEQGSLAEAALTEYAGRLAAVPGAVSAQVLDSAQDVARIAVHTPQGDQASAARELLTAAREVTPPAGTVVMFGGPTAALDDLLTSLAHFAPRMFAVMVLVTLVFLFLAFGSVVLTVKAVVLNVLSLSASFGLLVLVFQDGHFADSLGISTTGLIDPTTPLLLLAVIFGLSMDYEVFLLSRIREEWDRTGDNTYSVAAGLQHTGRIITSAAALFMVVIAAFSLSDVLFVKMIGLGMMMAVVIDATLVRVLLVPATMQLLGSANWWAPAPLARFWQRYGLRHG